MRWLIAKLLGWQVVYLMDFDGEVSCRLARPTPFGFVAHRLITVRVLLLPDGSVQGKSWAQRWLPANGTTKAEK